MTLEEIIELARQARLHRNQHNLASNPVQYRFTYDGTEEALIAFAKLVAEKEREAIIDIVAMYGGSVEIEAAIRARTKA